VIDPGVTFLDKARESLEGARQAHAGGRSNNCANRSYYACLQAAIYALLIAQVKPQGDGTVWNHGFVQGQFNGLLINRRHRYSPDLRPVLSANYELRVDADYTSDAVSEIAAVRALRRAQRFVAAIVLREEGAR
jgi:uncharacterized protein (UPF0332 family)